MSKKKEVLGASAKKRTGLSAVSPRDAEDAAAIPRAELLLLLDRQYITERQADALSRAALKEENESRGSDHSCGILGGCSDCNNWQWGYAAGVLDGGHETLERLKAKIKALGIGAAAQRAPAKQSRQPRRARP